MGREQRVVQQREQRFFSPSTTHLPRMAGGASSEMNMGAVEEKTPTATQAGGGGDGACRTDSRGMRRHILTHAWMTHTPCPKHTHHHVLAIPVRTRPATICE